MRSQWLQVWIVQAESSWTWEDKDNSEISETRYHYEIYIWDATGTTYDAMGYWSGSGDKILKD